MSRTIVPMADNAESRRGRPRSEEAHQAVLDAVARLLDDYGHSYEELTVERIAAEAGSANRPFTAGGRTRQLWCSNPS